MLGQNTRGVTPTEQALRAPGLTATVMQGYPRITIISVPSMPDFFPIDQILRGSCMQLMTTPFEYLYIESYVQTPQFNSYKQCGEVLSSESKEMMMSLLSSQDIILGVILHLGS